MIYYDFRTGDSRGFAFVRYKYADEAQKAVEKLDGMFLGCNLLYQPIFFTISLLSYFFLVFCVYGLFLFLYYFFRTSC